MNTLEEKAIADAKELFQAGKWREAYLAAKAVPEIDAPAQPLDFLRAVCLGQTGSYLLAIEYALRFVKGQEANSEISMAVSSWLAASTRTLELTPLSTLHVEKNVCELFGADSPPSSRTCPEIYVLSPIGICVSDQGMIFKETTQNLHFWEIASMIFYFDGRQESATRVPGCTGVCWLHEDDTLDAWKNRNRLYLQDLSLDSLLVPEQFIPLLSSHPLSKKMISITDDVNFHLEQAKFYPEART